MANTYIKIKEKEIPVIIRNYRHTNLIKMYFKGNVLNISKSKYLSKKRMLEFIKQNEEQIYEQYLKIISKENDKMKHWYTGEKISYKGEDFCIQIEYVAKKRIKIILDEENKLCKKISLCKNKGIFRKAITILESKNASIIL